MTRAEASIVHEPSPGPKLQPRSPTALNPRGKQQRLGYSIQQSKPIRIVLCLQALRDGSVQRGLDAAASTCKSNEILHEFPALG